MTKINILHLGLTEFFDRKSDIVYGLFHALNSLGHDTTITHNEFQKNRLNLIIGSDILSANMDAIHQIIKSETDYVIYEVENFNGQSINFMKNFPIENYCEIIQNAKAVITPYRYNLTHLKKIHNTASLHYARWGFHESMVSNNISKRKDFEFNAIFFGLIKGSRIIKKDTLVKNFGKKIKFIDQNDPFTFRDYIVSKTKFGLALSYGSTDKFVNPFRLYCLAANGTPILADHVADEDGYLSICECSTFDGLIRNIDELEPDGKKTIEKSREIKLEDGLRGLL